MIRATILIDFSMVDLQDLLNEKLTGKIQSVSKRPLQL
jgi:hypothetical protein